MTGNTAKTYDISHSTFGGVIYDYDFDKPLTVSNIAARIISDWNFDKQCRKNIENRKEV